MLAKAGQLRIKYESEIRKGFALYVFCTLYLGDYKMIKKKIVILE